MCLSLPYGGPGKDRGNLLKQLPGFLLMLLSLLIHGFWLRLRRRPV